MPSDEATGTSSNAPLRQSSQYKSSITTTGIDFFVPDRDDPLKQTQILHDVRATFKSGTCTAIMGPSGAGKTTFLKALCGHATHGTLTGTVTENGRNIDLESLKGRFGYAPQDDILWGVLTARELLTYFAQLYFKEPAEDTYQRVQNLLDCLGMDRPDVQIGDETMAGGLSGGQKKRVSIAMEIITEPSVLFLDEPTTGLDSKTAVQVCLLLAKLAKTKQMMILCTIHQPTWAMLEMFDQLLVLERGTVVYRDSPEKFCHYFKEQRHDLLTQSQQLQRLSQDSLTQGAPTPAIFEEYPTNPMDYFFECLAEDPTKSLWAAQWTKVAMGPAGFKKSQFEDSSEFEAAPPKRILGPFCQVWVLLKRATYMFTKTRSGLTLTTVANIVLNFLTGIAFFDVGFKGNGVLMGNGVFCIISATWLASTMITVQTVPLQKAILQREVGNGSYSPWAFWVSQLALRAACAILIGLICFPISYFLMGFTATKFSNVAACFFVWVQCAYIAQIIALPMGTIAHDAAGAVQMAVPGILPIFLLAGVLRCIDSSKDYTLWFTYINPITYFFKIYLYNVAHGHSDGNGNGEDILDHYDITYEQQKWAWIFLLSLGLFVSVVGYFPTKFALTKVKSDPN